MRRRAQAARTEPPPARLAEREDEQGGAPSRGGADADADAGEEADDEDEEEEQDEEEEEEELGDLEDELEPLPESDAEEAEESEEEPRDWVDEDEEEALPDQPEDPNAAKRFWFEHATGAGKTVAALGFVEGSQTGGVLILTHRRNLVDQFLGELRDRGYSKRISRPLYKGEDSNEGPSVGGDLPVVRAQRRQDLERVHDRDLRRGTHRARAKRRAARSARGQARSSSA